MSLPRILARSTKNLPPPLPSKIDKRTQSSIDRIPYCLQVQATIKRRDLPTFASRVPTLIRLIEEAGLGLNFTGWHIDGDVVHFFNYWDLNHDANSLLAAELVLPDQPAYLQIAQLIESEIKDIVYPINPTRIAPYRVTERYLYLRVVQSVGLNDLAEFAARMESTLVPFATADGWMLGDTYLGLTGQTGQVVQLWLVPERSIAMAPQRLATAAWQTLVREAPTYQPLTPAPGDPNQAILDGDAEFRVERGRVVRKSETV